MNGTCGKPARAEATVRVRYSETDAMGVAYHAHYLAWFNIARDELLQTMGLDVAEGERLGYLMPVVEAHCRYLKPARYGEDLIIRAEAEAEAVARLVVAYQVLRKRDKTLLATGRTTSVLTTKRGRLLLRVPEEFRARFAEKGL